MSYLKATSWGRYVLTLLTVITLNACASHEARSVAKVQKWIYQNEPSKALKILPDLVKRYPKNLDFRYYWGFVSIQRGDQATALRQFALCLNQDPKDYRGHRGLAEIFIFQKNYPKAIEELKLAILGRPDWPETYARLAQIQQVSGFGDDAIQTMQQGVEKDSHYGDLLVLQAKMYYRMQNHEKISAILDMARKRSFRKESLKHEISCIQAATTSMMVEKELIKDNQLQENQKDRLQKARSELIKCQKENPQGFEYQSAIQRINKRLPIIKL